MGLGFQTAAKPVRSFLRSRPSRDNTLSGITTAAKEFVGSDPWLNRMANIQQDESWVVVSLHPVAGDILFLWHDEGYIQASAKTSITGPGFHAKALELMDFIQNKARLPWDWTNADQTGYKTQQNFQDLQNRMADHARRLMYTVSTQARSDGSSPSIHLDPELPICEIPDHVLTPMGPASIDRVKDLLNPDDSKSLAYAQMVYPWWEKDVTPQVVCNTGLSLMWTDIPWRPPEDDEERQIMHLVKDCLEYAHSHPQALNIPHKELAEVTHALSTPAHTPFPEPRPDGIGYRRKICTWQLGSGWTIQLPGHWHADITDANHATVFRYRDRQVFCTQLNLPIRQGVTAQDVLTQGIDLASAPGTRSATFTSQHLAGIVTVGQDPENPLRCRATAKIADIDSLVIFSVFFADRGDLEWLTRMLMSVSHPR